MNGSNDLTQIEIVLTDFGIVGQNTKGGTPIFASPECFSAKTDASDIFSLGRLFLFMQLSKQSFLQFLYVPITLSSNLSYLTNNVFNQNGLLDLIRRMILIHCPSRPKIEQVRVSYDQLKRKSETIIKKSVELEINRIISSNISPEILDYINDLDHIS